MPHERFQFTGSEGQQLAAALDTPERGIRAYALFAHCFTCGKDVLAASRIAVALAAKGIAVLRFDFTGLGSSEVDFANSTFSSNVADLVRAADHLRETRGVPSILIGHSLGGAAVLAAAGQIPDAKAVVTIAAPSDPAHVTNFFRDKIDPAHNIGDAEFGSNIFESAVAQIPVQGVLAADGAIDDVDVRPAVAIEIDDGHRSAHGSDLRHDGIQFGIERGCLMEKLNARCLRDFLKIKAVPRQRRFRVGA